MTEEPLQGEFLREELAIDREFSQVRNWWVRYPRIVGNPLSIYLFIRSHSVGYRLTQESVRESLQLGRHAFLKARRTLEEHGFLEVVQFVYPAGSRDAEGRPIGGHRLVQFRLLDPLVPMPSSALRGELEAKAEILPRVDAACGQAKAEILPRLGGDSIGEASAEFLPWLDPHQDSDQASAEILPRVDAACGQAKAGNPTSGFRPLKEDQDKENQDQSSSVNDVTPVAVTASPDDDSDLSSWFVDLGAGLSQLVGVRVDARVVLERIARQHQSIPAFDLVAATLEVLTRARVSATPIKHRDGYVASSIAADLAGFVRRFPVVRPAVREAAAEWSTRSGFGTTANAASRACEERGHRFVVGAAHDRSCDRCGIREAQLQEAHAAAQAEAAAVCASSGHEWAKPTPFRVGDIAAGTILCHRCDVAASATRQAVS